MKQEIHPTAEQGFGQDASMYEYARPNYPSAITSWLTEDMGLNSSTTAIDLAAGTGKFTHYLAETQSKIIAVEPVKAMAEQFEQQHPNIPLISAFSHDIPLENQSVDAIVSAQAFHWFAHIDTLQEVHRLLKPEGHFGLIWNYRDTSYPWVQAISEVIASFEDNTPRFHHQKWQYAFEHQNLFLKKSEKEFSYTHTGTVDKVVCQRLRSTSFIAALPLNEQERIQKTLESIVYDYLNKTTTDIIDFPYCTYAYDFIRLE